MHSKTTTLSSRGVSRPRAILCVLALALFGFSPLSISSPSEEGETEGHAGYKKTRTDHDVVKLVFKESGQIAVLGAGDKEITPCGQIVKGRIVDNEWSKEYNVGCQLKTLDLLSLENIQVLKIQQNPNCIVVNVGGYLYKVHAGGDGAPPGAWPCHAGRH